MAESPPTPQFICEGLYFPNGVGTPLDGELSLGAASLLEGELRDSQETYDASGRIALEDGLARLLLKLEGRQTGKVRWLDLIQKVDMVMGSYNGFCRPPGPAQLTTVEDIFSEAALCPGLADPKVGFFATLWVYDSQKAN
jgi:hypothetical protein